MKRFFLTAIAMISAVACNKIPGEDPVGPQDGRISFGASSTPVRTSLSGEKTIVWESSDSISVFDDQLANNRFDIGYISPDGGTAVFTGSAASCGTYVAVYPWHFSYEALSRTGYSLVLPPDQFATPGSFGAGANLAFAVSSGDEGHKSLSFRQVGAFFSFSFIGCNTVTSIRLQAAGGEKIAGRVLVDCNLSDGSFSSRMADDGTSVSEILMLPAPGREFIAPGTYDFVFHPVNFSNGLVLYFTSGSGDDEKVCKVSSKPFNAERNSISRFSSAIELPGTDNVIWRPQRTVRFSFREMRNLLDKEEGKFVWPVTNFTEHGTSDEFYDAVLESGHIVKICSPNKSVKKSNCSGRGYFNLGGTSYPYTFRILFPPVEGLKISRVEYYSAPEKSRIFLRPCQNGTYFKVLAGTVSASGQNVSTKYIWNSLPLLEGEGCVVRDTTSTKAAESISPAFSAICATYSSDMTVSGGISVIQGRGW